MVKILLIQAGHTHVNFCWPTLKTLQAKSTKISRQCNDFSESEKSVNCLQSPFLAWNLLGNFKDFASADKMNACKPGYRAFFDANFGCSKEEIITSIFSILRRIIFINPLLTVYEGNANTIMTGYAEKYCPRSLIFLTMGNSVLCRPVVVQKEPIMADVKSIVPSLRGQYVCKRSILIQ